MPEDLPSAPSIRKMVEERRRKSAKKVLDTTKQNPRIEYSQDPLF